MFSDWKMEKLLKGLKQHPLSNDSHFAGEKNKLVKLLNDNIIVSKSPYGGNEYLINALNNSNKVKVYSERTGIIFDLDIIFENIFDRFNDNFFQEFIDKFDNIRKHKNPNDKGSKRISYALKK